MRETLIQDRIFALGQNEAVSVYVTHPQSGNRESITAIAIGDSSLKIESEIISVTPVNGIRSSKVTPTLVPSELSGRVVFATNDRAGNIYIFQRE